MLALALLASLFVYAPCAAGDVPYKNLGQFVSKDGTVDQEGCCQEMRKQDRQYYEKEKEEALKRERRLLLNFSMPAAVIRAIWETRTIIIPMPE